MPLRRHLDLVMKFPFRALERVRSRQCWKDLATQDTIKLEFGSGPKKGTNGWITVDSARGADLIHDLTKPIPLADNTVTSIYASHLFEHFTYYYLQYLVSECFRILKVGGTLSVAVPNSRHYIDAYVNKKEFRDPESLWQPGVVKTGSSIDQLNYIAYMGGQHFYLFDEENLVNTLKQGGFLHVAKRDFDSKLDLKARDFESIYAIAIK